MSEAFPEAVAELTWTLPEKKFETRTEGWDFVVQTEDMPNHQLRVKSPSELGIDDDVKQYSGYLDVKNDKHFFYWFFESRNDPKNDPVVLWLNGGPGCSSLTGLFMELGPSSIDKNGKPKYNPYSWNSNASVIFLDQPVNVGYSYSENTVSDTVAAGEDVYALLKLFFKQFPEYSKQEFHIAGESYAGRYIPVFASEILSHKDSKINLKSVLIGNGLTDPLIQYEYYEPMACGGCDYPAVLSENDCKGMNDSLARCQSLIQSCYDSESMWSCVPGAIFCNNAMMGPYQRTGLNVYDIRGPCEDSSNLCYPEIGYISKYLNQKDVMQAVGAEVDGYESCNFDVNRNFLFNGDWLRPFHKRLPGILESDVRVLIYAGDKDFICNFCGNRAWPEKLEWYGKESYNAAKYEKFTVNGKHAGDVKTNGNLTYLRAYDGGHMLPFNQPVNSLAMFNNWLAGSDNCATPSS